MSDKLSVVTYAAAKSTSGGGGGGGTTNYNQLENKPQIAGTTLQGNKSLSDLGIASETALGDVSDAVTAITDGQTIDSFADVETALSGKQATLTFDNVPTENSNNPVKSGGIYSALADKADASDVKNEFIGTTTQWDNLTTAEKKEYDTYQFTDDFTPSGSGLQYKTIEYTGDGTNPNVIDFGNDTPKEVLAIYQDPDYDIPNGVNYEGVMGWAWGFKLTQSLWSNRTGRDPNTSNGGAGMVRVTYNGNVVTVTGGNAASCGNANECHYIVAYLV